MSDKPTIAQKAPFAIDLDPGRYWWCACGLSANQPFCDGSHRGSDFRPVKVVIDESRTVYFCGCKHSGDQPFCDGTHNEL